MSFGVRKHFENDDFLFFDRVAITALFFFDRLSFSRGFTPSHMSLKSFKINGLVDVWCLVVPLFSVLARFPVAEGIMVILDCRGRKASRKEIIQMGHKLVLDFLKIHCIITLKRQ